MENIKLFSNRVELSSADNGNLIAKFILCDFNVNKNKVQLDRNTIENWMSTIVNQPLVGKIVRNVITNAEDFSGHNMKITICDDGSKQVEFDTNAYGSFTSVGIENIDGAEYLVATAEIWQRYPKVIKLISERVSESVLNSSWEIAVNDYTVNENGVKVITDGVFTAHCLLGKNHPPAFDCSRLLEVAEDAQEYDNEIAEAVYEASSEQETTMKIDKVIVADEETIVEKEESAEVAQNEESSEVEESSEQEEVASLTTADIYKVVEDAINANRDYDSKLWVNYIFPEEHVAWARRWDMNECDYYLFSYSINGESAIVDDGQLVTLTVSVKNINNAMAERDEAIVSANQSLVDANARITELEGQIASLQVYKEEHDQLVKEKEEAELAEKREKVKQCACSSKLITEQECEENEEIRNLIASADEAGIKQIIADRFLASLSKQEIVTSSVEEPVARAAIETEDTSYKANIAVMFANKKKKN